MTGGLRISPLAMKLPEMLATDNRRMKIFKRSLEKFGGRGLHFSL